MAGLLGAGAAFVASAVWASEDSIQVTLPNPEPSRVLVAESSPMGSDSLVLEGRPIGRITVRPGNIYEPIPEGWMGTLFRLANRLHIRTRPGTIRSLLLFEPGEPWSNELGREAARNLRALDFLYPQRIVALPLGDSVEVVVETRDTWTTRVEFNLESFEGQAFGSIALTELNLLGLGKSLSLAYREDPTGISRSFSVHDPGVMGSRVRLRTFSSTGTTGSIDQFTVGVPFYAEETRFAYGASFSREGNLAQLYQRGSVVAEVDRRANEVELFAGIGERRSDLVQRLTVSLFVLNRELGPARLSSAASPGFTNSADELRLRRLALEGRLWRPRFIERTYFNRLGFVEDYDVGSSFALKLGFSPRAFGGTAGEGYARMRLSAGAATRSGFGWVNASVSGRLRREPREVLAELEARWFERPFPRNALVLGAEGVSGSRMPHDFQTSVGGLSGLRAYPVQAVAGRRLWRFNAESRWVVAQNYAELLTLGVVGFADAARAWGVGAEGSTWFYSAGTGLRLTMPLWSQSRVLRVDVAWPISPTRDGKRDPVFSFGSSQAF